MNAYLRIIRTPKLRNHSLIPILLQPRRQRGELLTRQALALGMPTAVIHVQVLVDINRGVLHRINQRLHQRT
jgi:hypothetical protein